jgi:hypothetical protein
MSRYLIWERSLDPQETVDYSINWANDLGNDTIGTSTWTFDANNADAALVKSTPTKTNTTTTIWLNGGTSGVVYGIRNTIVTVGARTFERTAKITVRNS